MRYYLLLATLLSSTVLADGYANPYGDWHGQTQYQAFIGTTSDPAAHAIVNLYLSIDHQGKVIGISTENGCKILGLAAPGLAPTIVTLDVMLTNCNYTDFNRTYKGSLSVNGRDQYSSLLLQGFQIIGKAGTFNITATMRK
jgi:hypothetical protein